jgi:hypothetical protein
MARVLLLLFFDLAPTTCKAPKSRQSAASPPPALFENFGEQHRDIGSKVPAARRYFDQGRG